jgi:hypothetical protein
MDIDNKENIIKQYINEESYLNQLSSNNINLDDRIEYSISESDIDIYLGKSKNNKIIKYNEFKNYNHINQILKKDKDYRIVLIETKFNYGHFVCILRYGNTIEYFNSYGFSPSKDLDIIPYETNIELGQQQKWLNYIFDNSTEYNIIYNKFKFQKLENGINTCGRYCILRIIMLLKFNYNLKQFQDIMKYFKLKYKKSYDEIVSIFIH